MVMGGPAEVPKGFDAETTLYGSRRMVPTLEQSTSLHSQGGAKVCLINPPPPLSHCTLLIRHLQAPFCSQSLRWSWQTSPWPRKTSRPSGRESSKQHPPQRRLRQGLYEMHGCYEKCTQWWLNWLCGPIIYAFRFVLAIPTSISRHEM